MQTSKLVLVISAVTLLAGLTVMRAVETEAQKRAREALRQKMQEMEGQPPAPPQAPAARAPQTLAPTTTPAAAPVALAAAYQPDNEAQARARVALRQAMSVGQISPEVAAMPARTENAAQARAREALWQRMRELDAEESIARGLRPTLAYQPIAPPLPAVSGAKAARLAELLSRYRTDVITPEEYHHKRASIVAEP